jgi:hypothetical protein
MIDKINRYEKGLINLPALIGDLIGLLNALEDYDEAWIQEFQSNWLDLEVTYAVALNREIPYDDVDTKIETFKTTKELKRLVLMEIEKTILTKENSI